MEPLAGEWAAMEHTRAATLSLALGLASAALAGAARPADAPRKLKADPTQEYYLYLPKGHDPAKPCWLFVAVHDAKGSGAGALGFKSIATEGGGIVLAPTFKGDFHDPSKGSGKRLMAIIREVGAACRLRPKLFIAGFGQGAAFAHRFALANAPLVLGCAAHSADRWAAPNPRARSVPFLVTCGRNDRKPNRLAAAQKFAKALKDRKFEVTGRWLRGVRHSFSAKARELTKDFFYKLTTGMNAWERQKARECVAKANAALEAGKFAEAYAAANEMLDLKPDRDSAAQAREILQQVADAGRERLEKIDGQAKTNPQAAIAALEKLRDQFLGTPVAAAAAERIEALANPPEKEPGAQGERARPEKSPGDAKPDPLKMRRDCRAWLLMANNYLANKKTFEARDLLHKIIETYPDSTYARTARATLEKLER